MRSSSLGYEHHYFARQLLTLLSNIFFSLKLHLLWAKADHGREFRPLADHTTKLRDFSKGDKKLQKLHKRANLLQWTVDSGQWTVDSGQWTVDSGQWTVDSA